MSNPNIFIDDDYFINVGDELNKFGIEINKTINEYITILQNIKNEAIEEGELSDALDSYILYASKLKDEVIDISNNFKVQTSNFIKTVEQTDSFIF